MSEFALTRDEMDGAFEVLTVDLDEFNPGYRLHRAAYIRARSGAPVVDWAGAGRHPARARRRSRARANRPSPPRWLLLVSTGRALPGDHQLHLGRGDLSSPSRMIRPWKSGRPPDRGLMQDLSRVHIPRTPSTPNGERLPLLPDDLARLQQTITETEARLVFVDPLMAALSQGQKPGSGGAAGAGRAAPALPAIPGRRSCSCVTSTRARTWWRSTGGRVARSGPSARPAAGCIADPASE